MQTRLIVLGLAIALLHSCHASPETNDISSEESYKHIMNKTEKLIEISGTTFGRWIEMTLTSPKEMFEKVFEDVHGLDLEKEPLHTYIKEMHDYVELMHKMAEYREFKNTTKEENIALLHEIYKQLNIVLERPNTAAMEKPKIEDFIIEISLTKNGWDEFKKEEEIMWKDLNKQIEAIVADVSEEDKAAEETLLNWHAEYEKVKDLPTQLFLLIKLFRGYENAL
ncbi:uncharacterized protein LOC119662312 [Teleopsis dalmanni]|uniref:uncharacterized protein LOC119662312 n=1 Tax=Teleopsis dalmanni TaxID=139649 RepID=UPI0018CFA21A|nr:uncharacterized protein LOC119662312 [Teleopsis dalmanni]